ncbi:sensor histidine kinase [Hymenobacter jejuensis]|uniref:Signal transduction histidine kinase internal region domain-containing protein n=1 Tax=Hymenobacter jejuensis TaxID=2502781 RepID=A0A5B8A1T7_9BACT|nr:histidine kinase [Hymenobacter jejuensis]QDA61290.1 hypothetical protein FHG12_14845 [Hymenobacter jejuensis]
MKPWLQRRVRRHGLFWLGVVAFFELIQVPDYIATRQPLYWREFLFSQLPLIVPATYVLVYGLLPILLRRKQVLTFLGLLAAWLASCALLAGLLRELLTYVLAPRFFHLMPPHPFRWSKVDPVSFGFLAVLFVGFAASTMRVFSNWHKQQQINQLLQQRKMQADLQLLKAQLQPPFLFSTLATLQSLTEAKAAEAPAAVLQLSELLRYMLYESALDSVALAEEATMLRLYVALEQLRLGDAVDVSLTISGALDAHTLAPLLLLPFVENAFRHGTGAALECPWISIDLLARRDSLTFKVINSRAEAATEWAEGAGLARVRQRLACLYPGRHTLKIVAESDTFLVSLKLQWTLTEPTETPISPPLATLANRQLLPTT